MIELPNGTISRTLAEQVGFNSAKIAEIIKFLNESGLKDLVINLESDSGTLSTDQYAIAELSPSYMVYDGGVFYKVYEDSSYIDYLLLQEQVAIDSDMEVNHFRIRVERDSRNYALETVNIFTSYNKSQIDSALAAKANLSGANFTGAITAPSIIENMSGYTFTKYDSEAANYFSITYASQAKTGNKLTLVLVGKYKCTGGSIPVRSDIGKFMFPESIGQHLFPIANDTDLRYISVPFYKAFNSKKDANVIITKPSGLNTTIVIQFYLDTSMDLNTDYYFNLELTFLLGDNMAS